MYAIITTSAKHTDHAVTCDGHRHWHRGTSYNSKILSCGVQSTLLGESLLQYQVCQLVILVSFCHSTTDLKSVIPECYIHVVEAYHPRLCPLIAINRLCLFNIRQFSCWDGTPVAISLSMFETPKDFLEHNQRFCSYIQLTVVLSLLGESLLQYQGMSACHPHLPLLALQQI